jgi:queuosine precursor transporter
MQVNSSKLLPVFCGLFVAALLLSVTIAGKLIILGPLVVSASVLLFPLVFLFSDFLTEVYGYAASRRVIWTGFVAEILLAVSYTLTAVLPSPPFFQANEAYAKVFGLAPRLVLASLSAYVVGEFFNSFVLAKMKVATDGKYIRTRYVASTVAGQLADSIVFYSIAFYGIIPLDQIPALILSTWAVKVLWEIVALPVSIPITNWIKKYEQKDHFDNRTNFNPFTLGDE